MSSMYTYINIYIHLYMYTYWFGSRFVVPDVSRHNWYVRDFVYISWRSQYQMLTSSFISLTFLLLIIFTVHPSYDYPLKTTSRSHSNHRYNRHFQRRFFRSAFVQVFSCKRVSEWSEWCEVYYNILWVSISRFLVFLLFFDIYISTNFLRSVLILYIEFFYVLVLFTYGSLLYLISFTNIKLLALSELCHFDFIDFWRQCDYRTV